MDKVKELLEKHVQWVVLGIAALFLLYVAVAYVLQPPVVVDSRTPGEIDAAIANGKVAELEAAMRDQRVPELRVSQFAQTFRTAMSNKDVKTPEIAMLPLVPPHTDESITKPSVSPDGGGTAEGTEGGANGAVASAVSADLVEAPLAAFEGAIPGRSVVVNPDYERGRREDLKVGEKAPPEYLDLDWTTLFYTIDMQQLAKEFQRVRVPEVANSTLFLDVEMERQTLQSDGSWSEAMKVAKLPIDIYEQIPPVEAGPSAAVEFEGWARDSQELIIRPPFYQVNKGEQWYEWGTKPPELVGVEQEEVEKYDPATAKRPPRTPEERRAYQQFKEAERKRAAEERDRSRPKKRSGGSGGMPMDIEKLKRMRPAPADDERPAEQKFFQARRRPKGGGSGMPSGIPAEALRNMPPELRKQLGLDKLIDPSTIQDDQFEAEEQKGRAFPKGPFDPADFESIRVWAHDSQIEAGKTYRYRMRYVIKNPVFQLNLAPQELRDVFTIASEWTDWSEVAVPSRTSFYIVGLPAPGRSQVTVSVYTFKNGQLFHQKFEASPGDPIGDTRDKIDYSTGYTLVDVREDPSRSVLVLDQNNEMKRRTLSGDRASPDFQRYQKQMEGAGGPAASAR